MASKFHISKNGEPGVCKAPQGKCPLGDDSSHYSTAEGAQEAYENQMRDQEQVVFKRESAISSAERNVVTENVFITISDPDNPTNIPISEDYSKNIGQNLQPGKYSGYYYDEEKDDEVPVVITVDSDGSSIVERENGGTPMEPVFTPPQSPHQSKIDSKVDSINSLRVELLDTADASTSGPGEPNRLTLIESSKMIDDVVKRNDFNSSTGATKGFNELEDLKDDLNRSGHIADAEGRDEDAQSYWRASESLADRLGN